MKIFVLGHGGMLGHVVARYLSEQGYEVCTTTARYGAGADDPLVREVTTSGAQWIVNAVGHTVRTRASSARDILMVNGLLPVHLRNSLAAGQRLIHASSDGVFSGTTGMYGEHDPHDAENVYGLSKSLGELCADRDRCTVIRSSIVGPAPDARTGLLSWFLSRHGTVNGYTNHRWNGITTLEWAKLAMEVMRGRVAMRPVLQVASAQPVTKFELLRLIAKCWQVTTQIQPTTAPKSIDRTLRGLPRSSIEQQLQELRAWYRVGA